MSTVDKRSVLSYNGSMKRTSFQTTIKGSLSTDLRISGHLRESLMLTIQRESGSKVSTVLGDDQVMDLVDTLQKYLACEVA